jgi:hypothetical protein
MQDEIIIQGDYFRAVPKRGLNAMREHCVDFRLFCSVSCDRSESAATSHVFTIQEMLILFTHSELIQAHGVGTLQGVWFL